MELDILLRGQSNAFLFASDDFKGVGAETLVAEVQRLLGFDGATDQVRLTADWYTPGQQTIAGGTALLGDWMQRGANGDWQALSHEQDLLNYVARNPHPEATETAVVWLHSEYDSLNAGLTAAEWESAVRADAAWVREALGRDAAHSPYAFVSAIPFNSASDAATQAIRQGMEDLSADPSFGALVGARALDIDMGFKFWNETTTLNYGAAHMSEQDTVQTALRLARSLAEEWAEYARPGSPVALAGGDIADAGPEVVGAALQGPDTLLVKVAHDRSAGFAALDPDAAAGTGWSVRGAGGGVATADRVEVLSADTLEVHFTAALPADGLLYYGHGYGRLAEYDQPGRGNAVYDQDGMPLWTPAQGVRIDAAAPPAVPPAPAPLAAGSGPDSLVLKVSQDAYQGNAQYTVKMDGVQVGGIFTASAWHSAGQNDTLTLKGDWSPGEHQVSVEFLNDAWGGTAATDRNLYVDGAAYNGQALAGAAKALMSAGAHDFAFTETAPPPPPAPLLTAGVGPDALVLKISQDAYQGSAQYTAKVDGVQIGGIFTASALHGSGQSDTLTLKGDWASGVHHVEVRFVNDAWGGTAETDRNLYVDRVIYNGDAVEGAAQAIESDWQPGAFAFTEVGLPAPTLGTDGPDLFEATPAGGVFTGGGGRDFYMLDAGGGQVTVTDFAPGTDKLVFVGLHREDVAVAQAAGGGAPGLLVTYGDDSGVFLAGIAALADRDMVFA